MVKTLLRNSLFKTQLAYSCLFFIAYFLIQFGGIEIVCIEKEEHNTRNKIDVQSGKERSNDSVEKRPEQ